MLRLGGVAHPRQGGRGSRCSCPFPNAAVGPWPVSRACDSVARLASRRFVGGRAFRCYDGFRWTPEHGAPCAPLAAEQRLRGTLSEWRPWRLARKDFAVKVPGRIPRRCLRSRLAGDVVLVCRPSGPPCWVSPVARACPMRPNDYSRFSATGTGSRLVLEISGVGRRGFINAHRGFPGATQRGFFPRVRPSVLEVSGPLAFPRTENSPGAERAPA